MKRFIVRIRTSQSIRAFFGYYKSSEMSLSSIAVAYYLLLTIFPFLILLANIFPYLNIDTSDLLLFLRDNLPKQLYGSIANIIRGIFDQPSSGFLWLSLVTGFWTMSRSLNFLQQSFNKAYDVQDHRDFIVSYSIGLVVSVGVVVLLSLAIVLSTFGKTILGLIHSRLQLDSKMYSILMHFAQPATIAILFIMLAFLYYLLPNVKIRKWHYILPGTIFSSFVLVFTTSLFGRYVNYTLNRMVNLRNFGSITTFAIMIWSIFFARVLIMGAIFNATYQRRFEEEFTLRRGDVRELIQARRNSDNKE